MLTKTIVFAAALVAAAASAALATGFDPNMANRYPAYAEPGASPARNATAPRGTFRSAPVRLRQGRDVALPRGEVRGIGGQASDFEIDRNDRASSPYSGGGY